MTLTVWDVLTATLQTPCVLPALCGGSLAFIGWLVWKMLRAGGFLVMSHE